MLTVPAMHCGACMRTIEEGLGRVPGIRQARVNLTRRQVRVVFDESPLSERQVIDSLKALGYAAHPADEDDLARRDEARYRRLLLSLAVSGFAAGNVMLLSVSVWSGAGESTRDLFHWISALIAIPAVLWAGQPFFSSAAGALKVRRLNMDVPISLAILLALVLSSVETLNGGEHAWFDAAATLLFFLLIGRTLDHLMRRRAVGAAAMLARLVPRHTVVVAPDGSEIRVETACVRPGDLVLVRPHERIPVDGTLVDSGALLDPALVTGEAEPVSPKQGASLLSGTLNLGGAVRVRASRAVTESFIASMSRMMEEAESARLRYRRLSDRAAALYAPLVHGLAALAFVVWWIGSGDPWRAAYTATTVLIITCPCALALAVPMVQVVASSVLFRSGLLLRDGGALERLARVDHVVFDKTGTLTGGVPSITTEREVSDEALGKAAGMAAVSSHPRSRAILEMASRRGVKPADMGSPKEIAGCGVEVAGQEGCLRLGRPDWAGDGAGDTNGATVLTVDGEVIAEFRFMETLHRDAREAVDELAGMGLVSEVVSGDVSSRVYALGDRLPLERLTGDARPADKKARLAELENGGSRVLMVGDGLNDGPALAAAHASMAPSHAADVSRQATDIVFLGKTLGSVPFAVRLARKARMLMLQNLGLSVLYNMIAVPVAFLGFATPLVAAIAMSASSLVVTGNALRLLLMEPLER